VKSDAVSAAFLASNGPRYLEFAPSLNNHNHRSGSALLDALEAELEKYEGQLLELNKYSSEITMKYNEKVEFQECLEKGKRFYFETKAGDFFSEIDTKNPLNRAHGAPGVSEDGMQPLLADDFAGSGYLIECFVLGELNHSYSFRSCWCFCSTCSRN